VTLESCLCNAGVFTSCYAPEEGHCFVNIQTSMLDVCRMSGTISSRQFFIQITAENTPFSKHLRTVRAACCSFAYTTLNVVLGTEMVSQVQW